MRANFNPLLPKGLCQRPNPFCISLLGDTTNEPMCDTNLEASQVVLSSTVLSLRVAVLAVEKDGDTGQKF